MASTKIVLKELSPSELQAMLKAGFAGDADVMTAIVAELTPIIQMRVAHTLMRRSVGARGRNLRADVEDMVQDVFAALLAKDGKALKAWDPQKGLSLPRFVSFLAEREVAMRLRSGKRNPWTEDPTTSSSLEHMAGAAASPAERLESQELLVKVVDRLRERLNPQGRLYFQRLYIEEQSIQKVAQELGTTPRALYSWRNRLMKIVQEIKAQLASEERGHA